MEIQMEREPVTRERSELYEKYKDRLTITKFFNRQTVSFQANKSEPIYRWFKYKEGFSSTLVKRLIERYHPKQGRLLDPFAGAGTALFASQELGWDSTGIEVLPVGVFIMEVRQALENIKTEEFTTSVEAYHSFPKDRIPDKPYIQHIPITKDAYPTDSEHALNNYLLFCDTIENPDIRKIFRFAAFSVLEEISYTRKDGQYLRWDSRAPRTLKGSFNKGKIYTFHEAIITKLNHIQHDLQAENRSGLFHSEKKAQGEIEIINGSCLEVLPTCLGGNYDFVITSPPYCNRYDYTRTYALELIFLGLSKEQVNSMRQEMLSCTVENKVKLEQLNALYSNLGKESDYNEVLRVYNSTAAMTEVNEVLEELNRQGKLNNSNIPRMVRNYFLEMCFVIYEISRVLRHDGYVAMVNDNVRYGGEEIPVDLILSEFASCFGLSVEEIFVLERGKGNSSQQMGSYGRTEIRKCVYLWKKLKIQKNQ